MADQMLVINFTHTSHFKMIHHVWEVTTLSYAVYAYSCLLLLVIIFEHCLLHLTPLYTGLLFVS